MIICFCPRKGNRKTYRTRTQCLIRLCPVERTVYDARFEVVNFLQASLKIKIITSNDDNASTLLRYCNRKT